MVEMTAASPSLWGAAAAAVAGTGRAKVLPTSPETEVAEIDDSAAAFIATESLAPIENMAHDAAN